MKRVLFLIALLFSVVCYAAPPPENVFDVGAFIVQDNPDTGVVAFDVQEVAYNYIGLNFAATNNSIFAEPVKKILLPEMLVINLDYNLQGITKPPSDYTMKGKFTNYSKNLQHSNYGYPLTGDKCRA